MASVYDRTDIYDLFDSPKKDAQTLSHWQTVFDGRPIRSALDVSIGTGSLTLPLGQLGVSLYGSDLSGSMLARCRKKADERGIAIDLRQSDFRDLTSHFDRSFDCVMSTGNSLAYVTNNEITGVLEQMDALVEPGGCLYFDLRNWDRIVGQKKRFYCYNPAFLPNGDRVNLMQVWDHLSDGSIVFNLVYTLGQFTRNYTQTTKRGLLTTKQAEYQAPGKCGIFSLFCCLGFPKGLAPWHTTLLAKCSVLYALSALP